MHLQLLWFLCLYWFFANGVLFIAYTFALSSVFGAQIASITIGFPRIKKLLLRTTTVELGLLPIATGVTLQDDHNLQHVPHAMTGKRLFHELPLWQQLIFAYSNPTVVLAIALSTLGAIALVENLQSALSQLLLGAIHPLSYGQELLGRFQKLASADPIRAWGVLCAKTLPWQVIPFVGFPSMVAISSICRRILGRDLLGQVNGCILSLLWLVGAAPVFSWMFAIAVFIYR
jgi:hypothetical protein